MTDKHEYIRTAAYYIWMDEGCPDGHDVEIWNEAARRYELAHMKPVCTKKDCAPTIVKRVAVIVSKPASRKATKADVEAAFGAKKKPAKKSARGKPAKSARPAAKRAVSKKATVKKSVVKRPVAATRAAKKTARPAAKKPAPRKAPAKAEIKKKSIIVKMAPRK
jgi:hypothetical protein